MIYSSTMHHKTLSEFIRELQALEAEHGDRPVWHDADGSEQVPTVYINNDYEVVVSF